MTGISCIPRFYGKLVCHDNQTETLTTSLSYTVLSSYLVWRFLGTIGITHILCCYRNLVAMATRLKLQ